eukprot:TRINITY_DN110_c1_g1_i3.p1 TRINITY_DN110_c1_g1~~TRINITY_DN110_c1_g1_i3.p1  ORF type:complete len:232 (-),score=16.67 TRINITY_DN110_c1_g1_i3:228-923(-)
MVSRIQEIAKKFLDETSEENRFKLVKCASQIQDSENISKEIKNSFQHKTILPLNNNLDIVGQNLNTPAIKKVTKPEFLLSILKQIKKMEDNIEQYDSIIITKNRISLVCLINESNLLKKINKVKESMQRDIEKLLKFGDNEEKDQYFKDLIEEKLNDEKFIQEKALSELDEFSITIDINQFFHEEFNKYSIESYSKNDYLLFLGIGFLTFSYLMAPYTKDIVEVILNFFKK